MQLRRDGLSWHVAGEEVVVLDLEGSVYLRLNGSGRTLWELLTEPRTEDDLVDALVERYGIDRERAAGDVSGFITELRERELVEN
jgi:Coenzyme PQQ synthesis protein D (PqqD)